jgi:hypothetical protein
MKANGNPYPYAPYLGAAAGAVHGPRSMPKPRFSPQGGNPIKNMARKALANRLNSPTRLTPQAAKEILNDSHLKLGGLLGGVLGSIAREAE